LTRKYTRSLEPYSCIVHSVYIYNCIGINYETRDSSNRILLRAVAQLVGYPGPKIFFVYFSFRRPMKVRGRNPRCCVNVTAFFPKNSIFRHILVVDAPPGPTLRGACPQFPPPLSIATLLAKRYGTNPWVLLRFFAFLCLITCIVAIF